MGPLNLSISSFVLIHCLQVTPSYLVLNTPPLTVLFGVLESILIFVGHVIRTLFLSFSSTSLWEMMWFEGQLFCRPTCAGRNSACHCKVRLGFLSVHQHREELIFQHLSEILNNKCLYFPPKKLRNSAFSLHHSHYEEDYRLNADEVRHLKCFKISLFVLRVYTNIVLVVMSCLL